MKDRIRLSNLASYYLSIAKRNLKMNGQPNYVPMRVAFGRSLQVNDEPIVPAPDEETNEKAKATRGGEQPALTIFEQGKGLLFQALLSQKYKRKIEGDEYVDILTQHIEHGLFLIAQETDRLKGYDYLVAITTAQQTNKPVAETDIVKTSPTSVLGVRIGVEKISQKPVHYQINLANNPHFGIMGGSGSGKTYFLKKLLTQIRQNSHYETHFIIFDYKDGDIATDEKFVRDCNAEVIDVKKKPLPLNIFANAGSNEQEQRSMAEKIVQLVKNVEASIGKVQEDNLYNAIIEAYNKYQPYPDFRAIREELQAINERPDSLTSVLRPLVEQHYFANSDELIYGSWTNKTLIIDVHAIEQKDLVCFFVLNQIHSELKKLGVAPVDKDTEARQIRTVIVIDEAHYFLSSKKRTKVLENMIRDVRSSGGSIILASQSPDDYDRAEFNFLELMEFPIVLGSTPSSPKFLEQKFSLSKLEAKEMLTSLGKLARGEAYALVNKKPVLVELGK